MSDRLKIPVLLGSVRRDRQGIRAARFIVDALTERGHEPVLVDPLELQLMASSSSAPNTTTAYPLP